MPVVAATLAVAVAFAGLGLFIFARRLAGGFELGTAESAWAALALVAWGGVLRGFGRSVAPLNDREQMAFEVCLSCGIVALCLGVATASWTALLVLAAVLLEEGWAWRLDTHVRSWLTPIPPPPVALLTVQEVPTTADSESTNAPEPEEIAEISPPPAEVFEAGPTEDIAEESEEDEEIEEELDPNVVQQQTRSRDESGAEQISGWQRVTLAAGAQSAAAHVAFCPPLERAPQLEVHQLAGPDAQIKVAVSQPFGARFDIRLAKPAVEASELLIEYASSTAS